MAENTTPTFTPEQAKHIMERRHPDIERKLPIWELIRASYHGGDEYPRSNLWRHHLESPGHYQTRQARATFPNLIAPIVDMVSAFLSAVPPTRKVKHPNLESFLELATRRKPMSQFALDLARESLMYTVGILVDGPRGAGEAMTKADADALGLRPFAVMYLPERIRDFNFSEDGSLEWVILDSTSTDGSDPGSKPATVKGVRLWTRFRWEEFHESAGEGGKDGHVVHVPELSGDHNLGKVPFLFVNWRDSNNDAIAETPIEDVALGNRKVYNYMSMADEMLLEGTFQKLAWPGKLPPDLMAGGIESQEILTYDPKGGGAPTYIGKGLGDLGVFLDAIRVCEAQILAKLGMDTERDHALVASGVARRLEFEKATKILRAGSISMQSAEKWMLETAGLWWKIKPEDAGVEISYSAQMQAEDHDSKIARLANVAGFMSDRTSEALYTRMLTIAISDLSPKDRKEIETARKADLAEDRADQTEAETEPPEGESQPPGDVGAGSDQPTA